MNGNDTQPARGNAAEAPSGSDLSRRLERLGAEIDASRPAAEPSPGPASFTSDPSALGLAFRLSAEFVAGVLAGGLLGWVIDRVVGTGPWGLISCLILGFCAGMLNLLRASGAAKPARSGG